MIHVLEQCGAGGKEPFGPCMGRPVGEDGAMAELEHRETRIKNGRVLGWLSGLGIVGIPWLVSGIISTFTPEPESSFLWVFGGAFVAMVGWIVYGIVRVPRFRRGALIGSAIALGIVVALLLALVLARAG